MSSKIVLLSKDKIRKRIIELSEQISKDYRNREIHLIGVLKGSFIFLADLSRELNLTCKFNFVSASSYNDKKYSSGNLQLNHSLNLLGKHILIVEDIYDTGLTLQKILEDLKSQEPASLEVCVLLNKKVSNKIPINIKYIGFEIENRFVVGYGLDFNGLYRELPDIQYFK